MGVREQLQSTLDAGLQVARARECNSATAARPDHAGRDRAEYGSVTAPRLAGDLAAAIRHVCRTRDETEANCVALIAECISASRAHQLDLLAHFRDEARRASMARSGSPSVEQ